MGCSSSRVRDKDDQRDKDEQAGTVRISPSQDSSLGYCEEEHTAAATVAATIVMQSHVRRRNSSRLRALLTASRASCRTDSESGCWAPITAGQCEILPLPLSRTVIAEVVGTGCSDELAEYVAREARREYTEASQIFELVVASVAYDNSGVTHVVNGLVDRAVAFVRAIATREHEDSGGDPEALAAAVDAFVLKTFSTSDYAGGFAAFGSDPDAVLSLPPPTHTHPHTHTHTPTHPHSASTPFHATHGRLSGAGSARRQDGGPAAREGASGVTRRRGGGRGHVPHDRSARCVLQVGCALQRGGVVNEQRTNGVQSSQVGELCLEALLAGSLAAAVSSLVVPCSGGRAVQPGGSAAGGARGGWRWRWRLELRP